MKQPRNRLNTYKHIIGRWAIIDPAAAPVAAYRGTEDILARRGVTTSRRRRERRAALVHGGAAFGDILAGHPLFGVKHLVASGKHLRSARRLRKLEHAAASRLIKQSPELQSLLPDPFLDPSTVASPVAPDTSRAMAQTRSSSYSGRIPKKLYKAVQIDTLVPMRRRPTLEQNYGFSIIGADTDANDTYNIMVGQINLNDMSTVLMPTNNTQAANADQAAFHWWNGQSNTTAHFVDAPGSVANIALDNKGERPALPKNWYYFAKKYQEYRIKGAVVTIIAQSESVDHSDSGWFFVQHNDITREKAATVNGSIRLVTCDVAGPGGTTTDNTRGFQNINQNQSDNDILERLRESPHTDVIQLNANANDGNHSQVAWRQYIPIDKLLHAYGNTEDVEQQIHVAVGDPTPVGSATAGSHQMVATDPTAPAVPYHLRLGFFRRTLNTPTQGVPLVTGHVHIKFDISFVDPSYPPITMELNDTVDESS